MTLTVVFFSLIISLIAIALYWSSYFFSLLNYHRKRPLVKKGTPHPVSIIIVCKNEAQNIFNIVNQILSQDYPNFELIVVDDFSTDNTLEILQSYSDTRLSVLLAAEDKPGKKRALTQAINAAKYEYILLTDADCTFGSNQWIQSMMQSMLIQSKNEIVLGFSPMIQQPGLLNKFARYETIMTAIQYGSGALLGSPYMGVGRNLMFKKHLFIDNGGHQQHLDIASGDDDLFIQSVVTKDNTTINLESESFVYSTSKTNLLPYFNQKSRHISTSVHYQRKHQIFLFLFVVVQLLFYGSLFAAIIAFPQLAISISLFLVVKWFIQFICIYTWFSKLKSSNLLLWFPVLDMLMMLYYIVLPVYKSLFYKEKW